MAKRLNVSMSLIQVDTTTFEITFPVGGFDDITSQTVVGIGETPRAAFRDALARQLGVSLDEPKPLEASAGGGAGPGAVTDNAGAGDTSTALIPHAPAKDTKPVSWFCRWLCSKKRPA